MILGKFFQKNRKKFEEEAGTERLRILDLGSGTGILGIFLGCLGYDVVLSDLEDVIEGIAEPNIERNSTVLENRNGKVNPLVLDW